MLLLLLYTGCGGCNSSWLSGIHVMDRHADIHSCMKLYDVPQLMMQLSTAPSISISELNLFAYASILATSYC